MLTDVMFGIVGGVLADTLDRRRLLVAVQVGMVAATSILAALTIAGKMTPTLLLLFTFGIGICSVLDIPAYQSLDRDSHGPPEPSGQTTAFVRFPQSTFGHGLLPAPLISRETPLPSTSSCGVSLNYHWHCSRRA
jgi:MFS family permease